MTEQREVIIEWHDQPGELFEATVMIHEDWPEYDDDEKIFFYFSKESELEQAKSGEGFEFRIVKELE